MQIKTYSLDCGLTAAEVVFEDGSSWHFLPFEDRQAELFQLGQKYVLALGQSNGIAIFDTEKRVQTQLIADLRYVGLDQSSICFRADCGSLFVQEWLEMPGLKRQGKIALRKIAADGSCDQLLGTEVDMHVCKLITRSDGQIILVGRRQNITFDPEACEFRVWPFGEHERKIDYENWSDYDRANNELRWFSDDGQFGLRLKLKPEVTFEPSFMQSSKIGRVTSQLLARLGLATKSNNLHPDLPGDGTIHHGLAIEILRLAPVELVRTIVVRYYAASAFDTVWFRKTDGATVPKPKKLRGFESVNLSYPPQLRARIKNIAWPSGSSEFEVTTVEGIREVPSIGFRCREEIEDLGVRSVSLDGEVGPIKKILGEAKRWDRSEIPSAKAIKAIKKLIREKSTHKVDCPTFNAADVTHAFNSMRDLIRLNELDDLVFGEQLRFKFRVEGRSIGEKKFFERVRRMNPDEFQAILQPLRDLISEYGAKARIKTKDGAFPIKNSPSDRATNALSDAAFTLATLDDSGFDALRDWVLSVDQEHDYFAAGKVFPAFVKTTRLNTPEAIRFGVWYFYQQWQTVPYEKKWLGLFARAQEVLSPRKFASILVAELSAFEHFSPEPMETGLDSVKAMLGESDWSRETIEEAQRLLGNAQG